MMKIECQLPETTQHISLFIFHLAFSLQRDLDSQADGFGTAGLTLIRSLPFWNLA
jgi:hypothetical protein